MKKHRISKRVFAILLTICMVFTLMPANVDAATKGTIEPGTMGMTDINYEDRITWPIEIYDYYNDGMLFEYASYTGNTATWAELDKDEEYCYIPELSAKYYADYTTDAIVNSQVVRRWFDVSETTYAQPTSSVTGQKYFTLSAFDGKETDLIDFRDPDTDDVIEWCGDTNSFDTAPLKDADGAKLQNAYGYTFIIDHVDEALEGGDAAIFGRDSFEAYTTNWAYNVVLEPAGTDNKYKVVQTFWGNGQESTTLSGNISWTDDTLVMLVHADGQSNWMDWRAANALNEGDVVTISASKKFVTVDAATDGTKSGTVSKEDVQYATLVYRTTGGTYDNIYITPTHANGYDETNTTEDIYIFANTSGSTPNYVATNVAGNELFGWWYGILLTYDSTSAAYKVTLTDFVSDGTNAIANTALTSEQIAIIFHSSLSDTDAKETLLKYAVEGRSFDFTTGTLSALQALSDTSISSTYVLGSGVLQTDYGTMSAFYREAGSEELIYGAEKEIVLSSYELGNDWAYCVLDLTGAEAENIQSAGIKLADSDNDYDLLVSHFALFSSKEEAELYGEKALVYNKHYIQTLYPDNATYSADYTTSEIANATKLKSYWFDDTLVTAGGHSYATQTDSNGRQNYVFTFANDSTSYAYNEVELIDFNSLGGVDRSKLQYAVLVAYSEDVTYNKIQVYFRDESSGDSYGAKYYCDQTRQLFSWSTSGFTSLVFKVDDAIALEKVYSAGVKLEGYTGTWSDGALTDVAADNANSFMVRQFAFFETEEEAQAYAEQIAEYNKYSGVPTSYYNPIYDNLGYGLLTVSRTGTLYADKYIERIGYNADIDGDSYATAEDYIHYLAYAATDESTDGLDMSTYTFDGYQLYATLTDGSLTAGLLDNTLGEDGNPVYREEVIDYLALLMSSTLTIPEYKGGYFNYDFVRGEKSSAYADENGESRDIAAAIRSRVGINFETMDTEVNSTVVIDGTSYDVTDELTLSFAKNATVTINDKEYTVAEDITGTHKAGVLAALIKGQKLKGTWKTCQYYIDTCYDAAYFLLNNLFVENSYNVPQDTYDYLVLNKASVTTDGETKDAYVFDAGLTKEDGTSALDYNTTNKTIGYSAAAYKHLYYTSTTTSTTLFPFLPVTVNNTEAGMTNSPYFADPGVSYDGVYGETYYERDFNYVMKSSGEFVYHEDDGLFFEFEGDDDVYLFINGQLVLDIGGAHSITKERIDLNDYVQAAQAGTAGDEARNEALNLQEGGVYTFDFFYMERHGYGANCRIVTNMRVTDPALYVDKTAYRDGEEINYGGVVVADEKIEYNFTLENTGNTKLFNITFDDPAIGVSIDPDYGLRTYVVTADGTRDYDENGDGKGDKTGTAINVFGKNGDTYSTLDAAELTAVVIGYEKVDEGAGDYGRNDITLEMYEQEGGDYIRTINEVKFEATTVTNTDGTTKTITANEALKSFMATLEDGEGGLQEGGSDDVTTGGGGLWVNSLLTIKGIYYTLTSAQVGAGYFDNTVYATAETPNNEVIRGQDTHRVYVPSDPYYYQWAGKDIIITTERLVSDVIANSKEQTDPFNGKVDGLSASNVSLIKEVSYTGREISTSTVTIDNTTKNVQVAYPDAGTHVFYLKVYYTYNNTETSVTVPVVVYVTDVEDSYIVLDYGLSVDLTENNEIFKYDTVQIPGHETEEHIMGIASGGNEPYYSSTGGVHKISFAEDPDGVIEETDGTFTLTGETHDKTLTYTPTDFMDGMDSIWAAVSVHEEAEGFTAAGIGGEINIGKEVQMYEKISVLPASVVYYEDDFPAITYKTDVTQNTFTQVGDGSSTVKQSADQTQEYGQDDAYSENDAMSANSVQKITIGTPEEVASFSFKGTGFEIISRTNANKSATMVISVIDSEGNTVKYIPVVTEFDNDADGGTDEIYQVPVIRVNDLEYGEYSVTVKAIPTYNSGTWEAATLYIDGFRIYQPLAEITENTTTDEETGEEVTTTVVTPGKNQYYNDSENGAVFEEIRYLIQNGQAAIVTYDAEKLTVSTGTVTWTENRNNLTIDNSEFVGNQVSSVNDYLAFGPNNEVYMSKEEGENTSALVFYVEELGSTHNLQIAFRAVDQGLFEGEDSTGTSAEISYGVEVKNGPYWTTAIETTTATEQYYTIDYTKCPYIEGKGYQVAIKVTDGMISYTNLKYNGLTIKNMDGEGEAPTLIYVNGILTENSSGVAVESEIYPAFSNLRLQLVAQDTIGFDAINGTEEELQKILYQTRNGEDVRLIAYVGEALTAYEKVSFTITIGDKTSKELVCTTAYSGLYAGGKLYTTEDIYGEDGYFVTYTINNYLLSAFAGQKVTITAKYTMADGSVVTISRDVTIGTTVSE